MPVHRPLIPSRGIGLRSRGIRPLMAALLFVLGVIALAPAALPLLGGSADSRPDALAATRNDRPQGADRADGALPFADRTVREVCGSDLDGFRVDGVPMCTHGEDQPPPGDPGAKRNLLRDAPIGQQTVACVDDGQSGPRVEVLYVYSGANNFQLYENAIRAAVSDMSDIFDASARQTGGRRLLRLVTDGGCLPVISAVGVSASAIQSFGGSIDAVRAQGFNDPDRNYLMFADADIFCGIGTVRYDSTPGQGNINTYGGGYARADRGNPPVNTTCWTGMVAAHEVMHNLGGVQLNAPNSSGGWHCIDERDVMCYSDSPYRPEMQYRCVSGAWATGHFFDCNHDDYFHTNPSACSYLGRNWNTADSPFLFDPLAGQQPAPGPCLTVGSSSGAVGAVVRVDAAGFAPGESIALSVGGRALGTVAASPDGGASASLTIPQLPGGPRPVVASGPSGAAQGVFTVTPSLRAGKNGLYPGRRGRATVAGFGAGEQITLRLGSRVIARAAADSAGSASIRFRLGADTLPGSDTLSAQGARGSAAAAAVKVRGTSGRLADRATGAAGSLSRGRS